MSEIAILSDTHDQIGNCLFGRPITVRTEEEWDGEELVSRPIVIT